MIKKYLLLFLKLGISVLLLFYLLSKIDLKEIISTITRADLKYLIIGVLISPFVFFLSAYQLMIILKIQKVEVSTPRIMSINFITSFYGFFLPGMISGGLIRWYKISKYTKKRASVFASLAFNRIFYTASLIIIGIAVWIIDASATASSSMVLSMTLGLFLILAIYLVLFNSSLVFNLKKRLESMIKGPVWLREKLISILDATNRFSTLSLHSIIKLSLLSILRHIVGICSMYFLATAVGIKISFLTLCWVRALLFFVLLAPVSFLGIGVREGTLLLVLKSYGIQAASIMGLSFIMLGRNILMGLIGGIIEFVNFIKGRKKG